MPSALFSVSVFIKMALVAGRVMSYIKGVSCMTQVSVTKTLAVQKLFKDLLYQRQILLCFSVLYVQSSICSM